MNQVTEIKQILCEWSLGFPKVASKSPRILLNRSKKHHVLLLQLGGSSSPRTSQIPCDLLLSQSDSLSAVSEGRAGLGDAGGAGQFFLSIHLILSLKP